MRFVRKIYDRANCQYIRYYVFDGNAPLMKRCPCDEDLKRISRPLYMRGILFFGALGIEQPDFKETARQVRLKVPELKGKDDICAIESFLVFDMDDALDASFFLSSFKKDDRYTTVYAVCLLSYKRGYTGINLLHPSPFPTLYPKTKNYIPEDFPIYGISHQEWLTIRSWFYFD